MTEATQIPSSGTFTPNPMQRADKPLPGSAVRIRVVAFSAGLVLPDLTATPTVAGESFHVVYDVPAERFGGPRQGLADVLALVRTPEDRERLAQIEQEIATARAAFLAEQHERFGATKTTVVNPDGSTSVVNAMRYDVSNLESDYRAATGRTLNPFAEFFARFGRDPGPLDEVEIIERFDRVGSNEERRTEALLSAASGGGNGDLAIALRALAESQKQIADLLAAQQSRRATTTKE